MTLSRALVARWLALALMLALVGTARPVAAHPELIASSPAADAVLAVDPDTLSLTLTEAIVTDPAFISLRLLDEAGNDLPLGSPVVSEDGITLNQSVDGPLGPGTFTVSWQVQSAVDGHTISGSYGFRVGTGRIPGAATTADENPSPFGVLLRWLAFLGIAVAAGAWLVAPILARPSLSPENLDRRRRIALIGGLVALLATALEIALIVLDPPAGAASPALGDALRSMPDAWWLRLGLLVAALTIGLADASLGRRSGPEIANRIAGGCALAAVVGLSLTSHAAARATWRVPAVASDVVHQLSVALWVGGLVALLMVALPALDMDGRANAFARFSRMALPLALVAIATGVINSGLGLPRLADLWQSDYGRVIIAKVALLLPVLAIAGWQRRAIHTAASRLVARLRPALRLESSLLVAILLGGAILALLARPAAPTNANLALLDLPRPLAGTTLKAHITVDPAKSGRNTLIARLTDADNQPADAGVQAMRATLTSIDHPVAPVEVDLQPASDGRFSASGYWLGLNGWWQADLLVRRTGQEDATITVYMMLPDPNLHGIDAVDIPETEPDAEAVYQRGLAALTSLHSVAYREELSGGTGLVSVSDHWVRDDSFGGPIASAVDIGTAASVVVGDTQWIRSEDGQWRSREASPVILPALWGTDYEGATGFRLGKTQEINGEKTQIVTFYAPPTPQRAAAWYTWWVGTETGYIHRQAMVSRGHYMVDQFRQFNENIPIEPPSLPATPVASPVATPEA